MAMIPRLLVGAIVLSLPTAGWANVGAAISRGAARTPMNVGSASVGALRPTVPLADLQVNSLSVPRLALPQASPSLAVFETPTAPAVFPAQAASVAQVSPRVSLSKPLVAQPQPLAAVTSRAALKTIAGKVKKRGGRAVSLNGFFDLAHKTDTASDPVVAGASRVRRHWLLRRSRHEPPRQMPRVPHTSVGGQALAGWTATGLSAASIVGGLKLVVLASPWAWAGVGALAVGAVLSVSALGFFTMSARLGIAMGDHLESLIDPRDKDDQLKRMFSISALNKWLRSAVDYEFLKSPAAGLLSPQIFNVIRRHEAVRRGRFGKLGAYARQAFDHPRLLKSELRLLFSGLAAAAKGLKEMATGEAEVAPLLEPHRRDINLSRGLLIGKAFINTAMAFSLGALVDAALGFASSGASPLAVYVWIAALGGLVLAKALIRKIYLFTAGRLRISLRREFRLHLFSHLLRLPLSFTKGEDPRRLAVRLTQDVTRMTVKNVSIPIQFPHHVIQLALAAGFVIYSSWQLSLILLTGIPVLALLSWLYGRRAERYSEALMTRQAILTSTGDEILSDARQIGSVGGQAQSAARYARKADRLEAVMMKQIRISSTYEATREFLGNFLTDWIVLVLGFASFLTTGQPSIGAIMALRGYSKDARGAIDGVLGLYTDSKSSRGATKRVMGYLEKKTIDRRAGARFKRGPGAIAFKDVHFAGKLKGVSFTVKPGERAIILGGNASVRQMVVDLLLRLDSAKQGTVQVDDQDVSAVSQRSLQDAMALVQENPVVLESTIEENLLFGNDRELTTDEIVAMLHDSGASFLLDKERFPQGFDSPIKASGLSAVERLHLALARAGLRNPRIVIFDGFGVGFDSRERQGLNRAMQKISKGRTTIMLNVPVDQAGPVDRVMVLRNGTVAIEGDPVDVMDQDESFRRLLALEGRT
jgi:ABC-type multidrug transport system fused ATPase/permease subunit